MDTNLFRGRECPTRRTSEVEQNVTVNHIQLSTIVIILPEPAFSIGNVIIKITTARYFSTMIYFHVYQL